jgi:hypothetical protein
MLLGSGRLARARSFASPFGALRALVRVIALGSNLLHFYARAGNGARRGPSAFN